METAYIYINCKHYDGTVFVTQIVDWLKLYNENGISFRYFHQFYGNEAIKIRWKKDQLKKIKTVIPNIENVSYTLPERFFFPYINALNLNRIINSKCKGYKRVVIFSRMLYGTEIKILKKISSKEIIYVFDARGASKEEHEYAYLRHGPLSAKTKKRLLHIADIEKEAVTYADKIFSVSNQLKRYLINTYGVNESKFFIYPCLSDSAKFYYSCELRQSMRNLLGYNINDHVYLYSGGLKNKYHLVGETLSFLNAIAKADESARFLFLSKDIYDEEELLKDYPSLHGKIIVRSVANEDVVKYLNAADYGLLFRDDVIMNNVASPSKFAEYILCGLPTLISKGVGDYDILCENNNLGIKVVNFKLTDNDLQRLIKNDFNRVQIAEFGLKNLSKQAKLPEIIEEFKKMQ